MFTKRSWTYCSKTCWFFQESTWPALLQVSNARGRSACCVDRTPGFDAHEASLGWIMSSFLWNVLQDQLTWTAWLKISFALTTNARMMLDYRGNLATMSNAWLGECVGGSVTLWCLTVTIQTNWYAGGTHHERARGKVIKITSISLQAANQRGKTKKNFGAWRRIFSPKMFAYPGLKTCRRPW